LISINGRVEMNKFPFLIIFISALLTVKLAHCENIEDTLAAYDKVRIEKQGDILDSIEISKEAIRYWEDRIKQLKKELKK
jgi:hypothetical protein